MQNTWMNLQNVMLSKNSQTQITMLRFHLHNCLVLVKLIYNVRNQMNDFLGQKGAGKGELRDS